MRCLSILVITLATLIGSVSVVHAQSEISRSAVIQEFRTVRRAMSPYLSSLRLKTTRACGVNASEVVPFYCRSRTSSIIILSNAFFERLGIANRPSVRAYSAYLVGFPIIRKRLGYDNYIKFVNKFDDESTALAFCLSGAYTKAANDRDARNATLAFIRTPRIAQNISQAGLNPKALETIYRTGVSRGVNGCFDQFKSILP